MYLKEEMINSEIDHRNKGIGSLLIETAEREAFKDNDTVGLGVGLYKDYGQAQKIYIT